LNRNLSIFAALVVVQAVTLFAQTSHPVHSAPRKLKYLSLEEIDPSRILPPPPADGSEAQQREMEVVKELIHNRSKERYDQAVWDARHEDPTPFIAVLGSTADLNRLPATKKLLEDVLNDQTVATSQAKEYFKRKFPVAAAMPGDSYRQWTCDADDRAPSSRPLRSYPSGHATMAYTIGIVLSGIVPEKSQEILARSASYAYSREICGDHYHSDVEAGHVLGTVLGTLVLKNEALKSEIEASKAELQAAKLAK
jgi:acid phosphatase (class A)